MAQSHQPSQSRHRRHGCRTSRRRGCSLLGTRQTAAGPACCQSTCAQERKESAGGSCSQHDDASLRLLPRLGRWIESHTMSSQSSSECWAGLNSILLWYLSASGGNHRSGPDATFSSCVLPTAHCLHGRTVQTLCSLADEQGCRISRERNNAERAAPVPGIVSPLQPHQVGVASLVEGDQSIHRIPSSVGAGNQQLGFLVRKLLLDLSTQSSLDFRFCSTECYEKPTAAHC